MMVMGNRLFSCLETIIGLYFNKVIDDITDGKGSRNV